MAVICVWDVLLCIYVCTVCLYACLIQSLRLPKSNKHLFVCLFEVVVTLAQQPWTLSIATKWRRVNIYCIGLHIWHKLPALFITATIEAGFTISRFTIYSFIDNSVLSTFSKNSNEIGSEHMIRMASIYAPLIAHIFGTKISHADGCLSKTG